MRTPAAEQNTLAKDLQLNTRYATAAELDDSNRWGYMPEFYVFTSRSTSKGGRPVIEGNFYPVIEDGKPAKAVPVKFIIWDNYGEEPPTLDFIAAHANFVELYV